MTTPEDIEDRYLQLSGQYADRIEELEKLCELHGVNVTEALSLLPPIEPSPRPELARLHEERNTKLEALPVDLRAAVARCSELNEVMLGVKRSFAQKLCCDGHSVQDISERLGETDEVVVALLRSPRNG